jgi:pimeloyl-ACP methyl ester carboxylesterase
VLVHGLAGSWRWWRPCLPFLARRHRVHALDLPGFGDLRSVRFSMAEAPGFLIAWLDAVRLEAAPLVGHSLGAVVAAGAAAGAPTRVNRLVLASAAVDLHGRLPLRALAVARTAARLHPRFAPVVAADALRARPLRILRAANELRAATDWRETFGGIAAPTLLVWGARDRIVPPSVARELQQTMPDARLRLIERAGHVPMVDAPAEFAAAVLEHVPA